VLFNSYEFIFVFLPLVVLSFYVVKAYSQKAAMYVLLLSSLLFYGFWESRYLPILGTSVLFNFLVGIGISMISKKPNRRLLLVFGITANLTALCYYKYLNFIVSEIAGIQESPASDHGLPLGISFFTFTQIAFLVDVYKTEAKELRLDHYGLFVTFFPHLLAGPILHHKDMMPQFRQKLKSIFDPVLFGSGIFLFVIGLLKKITLADNFAIYVGPIFDAGTTTSPPGLIESWIGSLAYTFQLYFDFSGYTDMALGLALMFGIRFPLNFNSPYKATSIIDFWGRWHMTLSRFLRDYLYIPLGGNRRGKVRRYFNLFITMFLGGLWHGAGWPYLVWGAWHGFFICANHAIREYFPRHRPLPVFLRVVGALATFVIVVFGWVFFRASSIPEAITIAKGMLGQNGLALPLSLKAKLGSYGELLSKNGIDIREMQNIPGLTNFLFLAIFAFLIVWAMPNSQQIVSFLRSERIAACRYRLLIDVATGVLAACLFFWVVLHMQNGSEFLYYSF